MLRLINIWKKDKRFDPLILDRIRARCDPDYNGPPADSLPMPQLAPPPSTTAAAVPVMYGQPAQAAVRPPSIFNSIPVNTPVQPGFMIDQNSVFARAGELLNSMYASMGVAEHQRMPLVEIHRANPMLYQQIMGQAHHETMMRMSGHPPPAQVPVSQPVVAPLSQPMMTTVTPPSSTTTTTTTTATTSSDAVPTASAVAQGPPPNLSLSKMNAQNIIDRQIVNYLLPSLVEHGLVGRAAHQKTVKAGDNSVMVRTWFLHDDDWKKNLAHAAFKRAQLFETSFISDDSKKQNNENAISDDACVPKDPNQTHCALSGEEFETFWNEDEQMWMYKGAIRPDPAGPIYKVHAWLAAQRKHVKTLTGQALPDMDDQNVRKRVRVDS